MVLFTASGLVVLSVSLLPAQGLAQARESWVARHDEPSHGSEEPGSLLVDAAGNVYLAGASQRSVHFDPFQSSMVTLEKHDAGGKQLWSVGVELFSFTPALLSDTSGNLVLGGLQGLAKFDPQGGQLWVFPFDAGLLWGARVSLEGQGNILAARSVPGGKTLLVKLDPEGNLLWQTLYQHPSRSLEIIAMAADGEGSVVLTGRSGGIGGIAYLTVKLDPVGRVLWEALFSGPHGDEDFPTSLAVDGRANIFVGGSTNLLKYDPAGHELWRTPLCGTQGVRLDQSGDIFGWGHFITRFDTEGNLRWTIQRIRDGFIALVVGQGGNLYASSGSGSVLKIDGLGNQLWERVVEGIGDYPYLPSLAAGPDGSVLVSGTAGAATGPDRWTLKYDPLGREVWRLRQDGPGNGDDLSRDAVRDREGNLYVLGVTRGFNDDFLIMKLASDGRRLWSVHHQSLRQEIPRQIALGPDGQVVVSGKSEDDFLTLKYDARTGRMLWEAREAGGRQATYGAMEMGLDMAGNVWVSGAQSLPNVDESNTTVKYDPQGRRLWLIRHGTGGLAARLATDGAGNAYLVLIGEGASELVKISSEGRILWQARLWPGSWDLALDGKGFPHLAVAADLLGKGSDLLLYKFEPAIGQRLWEARYDGPVGGNESWPALVLDREGNSYLCGASQGIGPFPEYAVVKHDLDGHRVWEARAASAGAIEYQSPRLSVDSQGSLVLCGYTRLRPEDRRSADLELEVFRLSARGEWLWKAVRPGPRFPGFSSYVSLSPLLDDSGSVFIAGSAYSRETFNDLEVIKYSRAAIPFVRGDCDGDGKAWGTVSDLVFLLLHLFAGGPAPPCAAACDVSGDGRLQGTVADAVYLLRFDFQGGPPPPLPFPACGYDTDSPVACDEYQACAPSG